MKDEGQELKLTKASILVIMSVFVLALSVKPAFCWSNGGYSTNPAQPIYGTHDWIAQHALDYLPAEEKQYITSNLQTYLYGTELPDNSAPADGIGDTAKHHVYYSAQGVLVDDASAERANAMYTIALNYLKTHDYTDAAKAAGSMTHYIADLAVFGHVMGASTAWGSEKHHSDYESYVNTRTSSYASNFNTYLTYDGSLTTTTAYKASIDLAYDTVFGGTNQLTCVWMDTNYNWSNPTFSNRCGQSLNLAVNTVADVLHTLYVEANPQPTPTPTQTPTPAPSNPIPEETLPILTVAIATAVGAALAYKLKPKKKSET
ncbi:MAG: hypothetical protein NWE98_04900 [Candidatus Bathyarchaeota archaeon]|nr:hypothetical protein [Candidatus Bathyarchaeota archaeon]